MNTRARYILIATAVAILLASMFPPFQITISNRIVGLGYSFLFSPPLYRGASHMIGTVDLGTLFAEYVGILAIGALAWLFTTLMPSASQPENRSAATPTTAGQAATVSLWARFWARVLDALFFGVVIGIPAGALIGYTFPSFWIRFFREAQGGASLILTVMITPIWLIVEAFVLARWGTTPGKWIAGIIVRDHEGNLPSLKATFARSFHIWWRAYGLSLPLISLATLAIAYGQSKRNGGVAPWDKKLGLEVRAAIPRVRTVTAGVTAIVATTVVMLVGVATQQITQRRANVAMPDAQSWDEFVAQQAKQPPRSLHSEPKKNALGFDVAAARKAGYSDSEIVTYIAGQYGFDLTGARKAGYTDSEIIAHLAGGKGAARGGNYFDQFDADKSVGSPGAPSEAPPPRGTKKSALGFDIPADEMPVVVFEPMYRCEDNSGGSVFYTKVNRDTKGWNCRLVNLEPLSVQESAPSALDPDVINQRREYGNPLDPNSISKAEHIVQESPGYFSMEYTNNNQLPAKTITYIRMSIASAPKKNEPCGAPKTYAYKVNVKPGRSVKILFPHNAAGGACFDVKRVLGDSPSWTDFSLSSFAKPLDKDPYRY